MSKAKVNVTSRRRFLRNAVSSAAGLAGLAVLVGIPARQSLANTGVFLRPPGALPEPEFNHACIRCGQCSQACPYDILKPATLLSGVNAGTPYFIARNSPCEMCDDMPCVKACPSGALDPALTQIEDARMGLAVLLDHENCLSWQGLRCDECHRVCPLINQAITIERQRNERTGIHAKLIPTVHSDYCTGCGKCEQACILSEAAIKVLPLALARGQLGQHYRFGWQEKQRAGQALVKESIPMPVRKPEEAE